MLLPDTVAKYGLLTVNTPVQVAPANTEVVSQEEME